MPFGRLLPNYMQTICQNCEKGIPMRALSCQAHDCAYNKHSSCIADNILISIAENETFCDTYTRNDSFVAKPNIADTEFGDEMCSPKITCNVSQCIYNQSFRCQANKVQIDDPHDEMICNCITYRPK